MSDHDPNRANVSAARMLASTSRSKPAEMAASMMGASVQMSDAIQALTRENLELKAEVSRLGFQLIATRNSLALAEAQKKDFTRAIVGFVDSIPASDGGE